MKSATKRVYSHQAIENKWQSRWEKDKLYSPDIKRAKKPFYNLWMFPYPSAEGLHAGHAFASTGSDIYGRFQRMNGFDVFQPIGYDSFGIHSENYAIKINEQPETVIERTTKHYAEQMKSLGHGYDWTRTVTTSDVDYYRWTQWVFVELFKAGLAYRKKAEVNFCPGCKTVLADEQIMTPAQAGKIPPGYKSIDDVPEGVKVCERCGNIPERKELEQWFFRITDYADRLLTNLEKIDWSERVAIAQRNWIGRSQGMLISFEVEGDKEPIQVFTTRPDTLNGATFIAVSDDALYNKYRESKGKFGEFTGKYAINPLNNRKLPIWKTNYVASGYGTGAIMGVPAHDERDADFAKKYHIGIVNEKPDEKLWDEIQKKKWGKKHSNYHLRDWLISRQRYWGPPIPMIYCEHCAGEGKSYFSKAKPSLHTDQSDWESNGWYPAGELPVKLPHIEDYQPKGTGRGPLAAHPEFYKVKCPGCGSDAERETDVSDTFLDSAWYFLRYPSTRSARSGQVPWDDHITKKWLPVSLYFGGAEHAVLHLMYARFVSMAFNDLKEIEFEEPFPLFFAHGLMIKDGAKMSKSRGNVVNPDEYVKKFGSDTLRLYLMFMGPMDGSPDFRDTGIEGMAKFIRRVWSLYDGSIPEAKKDAENEVRSALHKTIKKVTEDIKVFHYNTAIASMMELVNLLKDKGVTKEAKESLIQLVAPFAPHLAEEIWVEILGKKYSVHTNNWPQFESKYIKDSQKVIVIQVNGKVRGQLSINDEVTTAKKEIEEMSLKDEKVAKFLKDKRIKTVVYVPNKIINFVTN